MKEDGKHATESMRLIKFATGAQIKIPRGQPMNVLKNQKRGTCIAAIGCEKKEWAKESVCFQLEWADSD